MLPDITGDFDPQYDSSVDMCGKMRIDDDYMCTRPCGHLGPHRAHWSDGRVCCPDWSNEEDDPDLHVGEGL